MKKIIIVLFLLITSTAYADDTMIQVFDKIDDLITRIESGISLNSFAETLAQMKIDYKKAVTEPDRSYNPLASDRMKKVLEMLDDYARAWKIQEIDGYKNIPVTAEMLSKYSINSCMIRTKFGDLYGVTCIKNIVLNDLKPNTDKAKSAHFNGW